MLTPEQLRQSVLRNANPLQVIHEDLFLENPDDRKAFDCATAAKRLPKPEQTQELTPGGVVVVTYNSGAEADLAWQIINSALPDPVL